MGLIFNIEIFNNSIKIINDIILIFVGIAVSFQMIYILLFFLPKKKIEKSLKKEKFAVIIPAHNEEDKLGVTLSHLMHMNYPKELYDVFVVCDNSTDRTLEIAKKFDCIILNRNITNPNKKGTIGHAFHDLFNLIKYKYKNEYFGYIHCDADNILHPDYIDKMNDALHKGWHLCKGYNHSTNFTQSIVSSVSSLWYGRENRFTCRVKEKLHIGQLAIGPGMTFSNHLINEMDGWNCCEKVEDTQFTIESLLRGYKAHYVEDAIVYEDQASSIKDTFKRFTRIGKGCFSIFKKYSLKLLKNFFTKFDFTFMDMFIIELFPPITLLICTWVPIYYIYVIIFHFATGGKMVPTGSLGDSLFFINFMGFENINILIFIGAILIFAFILPMILQSLLYFILDRKKIGIPFKKSILGILCFPGFMILYAIAIFTGIVSNAKWKMAKRNQYYDKEFIVSINKTYNDGYQFIKDPSLVEKYIDEKNQIKKSIVYECSDDFLDKLNENII